MSTLDISASDESSPNSSTSPSLAQLGIAEFLPGPNSHHHQHPSHSQAQQPSSGSSSDNNSSTMWEDITSSITKLDPDCADALQLMAPAVSATPGMGTFKQSFLIHIFPSYFFVKIVKVLECFKFKVQRNLMLFRSCLSWTESRRVEKGLILSLICPRIKSMIYCQEKV